MPWQTLCHVSTERSHSHTRSLLPTCCKASPSPAPWGTATPWIQIDKGWHSLLQALLQLKGRGSAVRSPNVFYSALQSQTVPSFISQWKGHMGRPSPKKVWFPGPLMLIRLWQVTLCNVLTPVTCGPGSAPPFRGRIWRWHNSTWTAEFWCSAATRFFRNTKDQRKLLAFEAKDREVCSALL